MSEVPNHYQAQLTSRTAFILEAPGEIVSSLFQHLEATYILGPVAPSAATSLCPLLSASHLPSLWASCLPLLMALWLHWALLGNPGCSPHLKALHSITSTTSLLCKVTYSQVSGVRMCTSLGAMILLTICTIIFSLSVFRLGSTSSTGKSRWPASKLVSTSHWFREKCDPVRARETKFYPLNGSQFLLV